MAIYLPWSWEEKIVFSESADRYILLFSRISHSIRTYLHALAWLVFLAACGENGEIDLWSVDRNFFVRSPSHTTLSHSPPLAMNLVDGSRLFGGDTTPEWQNRYDNKYPSSRYVCPRLIRKCCVYLLVCVIVSTGDWLLILVYEHTIYLLHCPASLFTCAYVLPVSQPASQGRAQLRPFIFRANRISRAARKDFAEKEGQFTYVPVWLWIG